MKKRWVWNPETERILDMKYKKSYSRKDFKEIFKFLAKTEERKQALRKMASKSEKGHLKWKKTCMKKWGESRGKWFYKKQAFKNEIEELKKKNNVLTVEVLFHKSQKEQIVNIIKGCDTKEEILEICKERYLINDSGFTEREEKSIVPPAVFDKNGEENENRKRGRNSRFFPSGRFA